MEFHWRHTGDTLEAYDILKKFKIQISRQRLPGAIVIFRVRKHEVFRVSEPALNFPLYSPFKFPERTFLVRARTNSDFSIAKMTWCSRAPRRRKLFSAGGLI